MREWLRMARAKNRITQRALANIVGVREATINHIENGHSNPSVKLACKIAMVLDVDPLEFVRFESETYVNEKNM